MFATLMSEQHGTKIAVFGGKPGLKMEYKGGFSFELLCFPASNASLKAWPEIRLLNGQSSILRSRPLDSRMSVVAFPRLSVALITINRTPWLLLICKSFQGETFTSANRNPV